MNFSLNEKQRAWQMKAGEFARAAGAGPCMDAMADRLVRDGIIWTHLAGDTTQRLKGMRRFPK